jgi:hypothetical protein
MRALKAAAGRAGSFTEQESSPLAKLLTPPLGSSLWREVLQL